MEKLVELFERGEIYKGEVDEDVGEFKDETIATHLKDKRCDSNNTRSYFAKHTSPNKKESDQLIPWEISYSLKEISGKNRAIHTNVVLVIVLADDNSNYDYYLEGNTCFHCNCRTH